MTQGAAVLKDEMLSGLRNFLKERPSQRGVEMLCDIFYYCSASKETATTPLKSMTEPEKADLLAGLRTALPLLEDSLYDSSLDKLGCESISTFRIVRSGLRYLQTMVVEGMPEAEDLKKIVQGVEKSVLVVEIDGKLRRWKASNAQDDFPSSTPIDLRSVPEDHDWWLDLERAESKTYHDKASA